MTATYPTSRRSFSIEEAFPAAPLIAGLARGIADWQNYTYNSDLPVSPSDAKVFGAQSFGWQPWTDSDTNPSPQRTASSSLVRHLVASCYVPAPRIPTSGVRVLFWVTLGATNSVGTVEVESSLTGAVYTTAVTYAACGSVLTGAWLSVDAETQAGDILNCRVNWTSGGSITVEAVSGYHKATTLWGSAASWSAISQAHIADDRPCHSQLRRWLAKSCNRFMMHRAPMQFLSSYLATWGAGNTAGFGTETYIGRYAVLVGEGVTSLRVAVYAKSSGSTTVIVRVDGVDKHTFTVNSGTYAWQEASVTITGPTEATQKIIDFRWGGESTTNVKVASISVWEETATLTLPGAESVPGSFVANDNGAMSRRGDITSAQWATMIANMVWLWKYRGLRMLVCDSRFTSCIQAVDNDAPAADHENQGIRRFRFADTVGVPRVYPHWHGWVLEGTKLFSTQSFFYPSSAWVDESTAKASAATATRVEAVDVREQCAVFSSVGGLHVESPGERVRALASPPWVESAAQTQDYSAWVARDAGSVIASTRICGLVIEQAPKNQTAGSRY